MSILAKDDVKSYLGITDTSLDSKIDSLLPSAEQSLFDFTNNKFEKYPQTIFLSSDSFVFDKSNLKIKNSDSTFDFKENDLKHAEIIRIRGSLKNDGYKKVESFAQDSITLKANEPIENESTELLIKITFVSIPENAKLFIAKIVEFLLPNEKLRQGIESEKFDDYSFKMFNKASLEALPLEITTLVENYMKLPEPEPEEDYYED